MLTTWTIRNFGIRHTFGSFRAVLPSADGFLVPNACSPVVAQHLRQQPPKQRNDATATINHDETIAGECMQVNCRIMCVCNHNDNATTTTGQQQRRHDDNNNDTTTTTQPQHKNYTTTTTKQQKTQQRRRQQQQRNK